MTKSAKIRKLMAKGLSVAEIAKRVKVHANYVHTIKWLDKKNKKPEKKAQFKSPRSRLIQDIYQMKNALNVIEKKPEVHKSLDGKTEWVELPTFGASDLINHPPHYKTGGVETIDFIEAKDLNYRLGNVVKYVSRAGKKDSDPVQDLEKAAWYLQREITARKSA